MSSDPPNPSSSSSSQPPEERPASTPEQGSTGPLSGAVPPNTPTASGELTDSSKPDDSSERRLGPERAILHAIVQAIRSRVVSGLILVMPLVVTLWVLIWMYQTFRRFFVLPIASLLQRLLGAGDAPLTEPTVPTPGAVGEQAAASPPTGGGITSLPPWLEELFISLIAITALLVVLYFLGMLLRSRIHRAIDGILLRVPVVTVVYKAVRNIFESINLQQGSGPRFRRVVLVAFPHPGMRAPGFVTSSCRDAHTGKTILCVYVPTTPIPTSGYMLLVPEEEVTELDWDVNETLQAIASGGISTPDTVQYFAPPSGASMLSAETMH